MRRSLGALSDVTEDDEHHSSNVPPPPPSITSPQRNDRQSVASQFSDVSELQDFLADDYVEKFKARSPPPAPRLRRAPSLDQPSTPTSSAHAPLHTLTQCEFISGCSDPKVDDEAFEDFQIPEPPTPETPVDGDKARGADGKMAPPSVVLHCAQRWRTRDGPDAAKRLLPVRIVMGNGAVGQQTNAAY